VFAREDGEPLHPEWVSDAFQSRVVAAGASRITLHSLRHTWASLALQAGVNPKVVSERLGHATVSFTLDTYSHVMPGMQEEAAAAVASLVLGAQGCNRVAVDRRG
jgi:integrase